MATQSVPLNLLIHMTDAIQMNRKWAFSYIPKNQIAQIKIKKSFVGLQK